MPDEPTPAPPDAMAIQNFVLPVEPAAPGELRVRWFRVLFVSVADAGQPTLTEAAFRARLQEFLDDEHEGGDVGRVTVGPVRLEREA